MSDFHRASLEMAWLHVFRITNESTEIENYYSSLNRELRWLWNSVYYFFLELSPLVKLRPFEKIKMKFCKCHISKSIKDRNLKLVSAERG